MRLQVGQIVRGSYDLHDTFKTLAPKGLILKFHEEPGNPVVKYVDGEYIFIREFCDDAPMDSAWMCLRDPSWEFIVIESPILRITRTKVLYDN